MFTSIKIPHQFENIAFIWTIEVKLRRRCSKLFLTKGPGDLSRGYKGRNES